LLLGGSTALAAPFVLRPRPARAANAVNVMAYDGFVPPAFKAQFEAETGIEVRLRSVGSQAPELNLLVAERPHPLSDIATVAGHRLRQFVDAQVIAPLDTSRLKQWSRIDPLYARAPWNQIDGATMGLPLVTGAEVLVRNTEQVAAADSWGAMFDPRFRGRTTYVVEDFLQCTMLFQGADGTFASYVETPEDAARAVAAARDLLIRTKSQVVKYYDEGAELQQMLLGGDAWLAQAYAGGLARMILAGAPVRFDIPREGSFAFVYDLALVRDGPNPDNAYRFLDALLAWPGVGAAITRSAGYISTFTGAAQGLTALEREAYMLTPAQLSRLSFFRYEGQRLSSALIDRAVEEVKAA
jgi:spermidine/putrescine transport system substrate-binding protein